MGDKLTQNEFDKLIGKVSGNGCGCKDCWFRPPQFVFEELCDVHDRLYSIGGSLERKKQADKCFYYAMKRRVRLKSGLNKFQRLYGRALAFLYYRTLKLGYGKDRFRVK